MKVTFGRTFVLAALGMGALLMAGCPRPDPPLPPRDEIIQVLSYAMLAPEITCAELRQDFGLGDLPLIENPAEAGIDYEVAEVTTASGIRLRVWYVPGSEARGVVVVSPGNTGPMSCYLMTVTILHYSGWTAVMYDYPGFGGSSGEASLPAVKEALEAVVEWTLQKTGSEQVSLMGMSLGSIPSIAVAVEQPDVVNAVVLDSPVALGKEIERFGFLVQGRWAQIVALLDPWMIPEQLIAEMRQPLLVFEHGQDVVTPPETVELMYERAGGPATIVRFQELGHAAAQFLETERYAAELDAFLTGVWGR
jgi:pimeloyl-ACP methyl ester carboxylesterase